MPTARPIIDTMFVTNRLNSTICPTSDTTPRATAIAARAMTIGSTAATTAANTTTSTTRAAAIPMVSPRRRSSSAIREKSAKSAPWPATSAPKPSGRARATTPRSSSIVETSTSLRGTVISVVRPSAETNRAASSGAASARS